MTKFSLSDHSDGGFSAWPPVEVAIQRLNLPVTERKRLETALAAAVGHALACGAASLCIRLLISEQIPADEIGQRQAEIAESQAVEPASRRSWGFFLIHTQVPKQGDPQSAPCYKIELFVYREDERSEPDSGE